MSTKMFFLLTSILPIVLRFMSDFCDKWIPGCWYNFLIVLCVKTLGCCKPFLFIADSDKEIIFFLSSGKWIPGCWYDSSIVMSSEMLSCWHGKTHADCFVLAGSSFWWHWQDYFWIGILILGSLSVWIKYWTLSILQNRPLSDLCECAFWQLHCEHILSTSFWTWTSMKATSVSKEQPWMERSKSSDSKIAAVHNCSCALFSLPTEI